MLRRAAVAVATVAMLSLPSLAKAQLQCVGMDTCSISPTASLTIPKVVRLAADVSSIVLATPDFSADSLNGQSPTTVFNGLSVRANHPWSVNLSSAAANWTYTPAAGASGGVRAREELEFQVNCAGAWAPLSAAAASIATGTITNGAAAQVCLRTAFPNDYENVANRPGTYTLALTLTLAAN